MHQLRSFPLILVFFSSLLAATAAIRCYNCLYSPGVCGGDCQAPIQDSLLSEELRETANPSVAPTAPCNYKISPILSAALTEFLKSVTSQSNSSDGEDVLYYPYCTTIVGTFLGVELTLRSYEWLPYDGLDGFIADSDSFGRGSKKYCATDKCNGEDWNGEDDPNAPGFRCYNCGYTEDECGKDCLNPTDSLLSRKLRPLPFNAGLSEPRCSYNSNNSAMEVSPVPGKYVSRSGKAEQKTFYPYCLRYDGEIDSSYSKVRLYGYFDDPNLDGTTQTIESDDGESFQVQLCTGDKCNGGSRFGTFHYVLIYTALIVSGCAIMFV